MKLTDLQLKSAETLAKLIAFENIPNLPTDIDDTVSKENLDEAITIFSKRGYTKPLTLSIIIEGLAHKSFKLLNYRVKADPLNEIKFVFDYIKNRTKWLRSKYPDKVFRVETFVELLKKGNWDLKSPITVYLSNGKKITIEEINE